MLRTNDYKEIYQAYIDTVRFHIDSLRGQASHECLTYFNEA